MGRPLPEITILRDSREQTGWHFDEEKKKPGFVRIIGTVTTCLSAGDYTIAGYEDLVIIERKHGFNELFGNLMFKENKERFEREIEKLVKIKHRYLVIETVLNEDILSLSIPQMRVGPPVSKLLDTIFQYQIKYNIIPIFAGSCGKKVAKKIFTEIAKEYRL